LKRTWQYEDGFGCFKLVWAVRMAYGSKKMKAPCIKLQGGKEHLAKGNCLGDTLCQ